MTARLCLIEVLFIEMRDFTRLGHKYRFVLRINHVIWRIRLNRSELEVCFYELQVKCQSVIIYVDHHVHCTYTYINPGMIRG